MKKINYKKYMMKINRKKLLKIIIPITLVIVCIIVIPIGIVFSKNPKSSIKDKKSFSSIGNDINDYFSDNPQGKPFWFYTNNKTQKLSMSYVKDSVEQDAYNKEKVTAKININDSSGENTKTITIHFDWEDLTISRDVEWNNITKKINNLGYDHESDSLTANDVKIYIDKWISTSQLTWYETTFNHKITFTSTDDVKINSEWAFTEYLKPSTTTYGNKDVYLVLKWFKAKDENTGDIISYMNTWGYANQPVFIPSEVKKDVNNYLANISWFDSKKTLYKFISTKVIRSDISNWTVTIDQNSTLKIENMSFTSFNITLDWKNQQDATSKLFEIDTQIIKKNYVKQLSADQVFSIFKNFIASGKWTFSWIGQPFENIDIVIDSNAHNGGITPLPAGNYGWEIDTIFNFVFINPRSKYNHTYKYLNKINLNWKAFPSKDKIHNDIMYQYNKDEHYRFTFTLNK